MFKTYLAVATVALSLGTTRLSFTEKQELPLCPIDTTTVPMRLHCNKPLFQTVSVASAFYGRTGTCGCPSGGSTCSNCAKNVTSGVRDKCQDRLPCKVEPGGIVGAFSSQLSCGSSNMKQFLNVSYNCTNIPGYMGCFRQEGYPHVLSHMSNIPRMTIWTCLRHCDGQGFLLAGLWNGSNCLCGNGTGDYTTSILTAVGTSECNVSCPGGAAGENETCGGVNSIDIYNTSVGRCSGKMEGESEGVLFSPRYPHKYPPNRTCVWLVSVPEDRVIKVTFHLLDLKRGANTNDNLELRDGEDENATLLTLSVTGTLNQVLPVPASSSNVIRIKFQSDLTGSGKGFILKYKAIGHCGRIDIAGQGRVIPNHNGNFGIGETARIKCTGDSPTVVVGCLDTGRFNVTPPNCTDMSSTEVTLPSTKKSSQSLLVSSSTPMNSASGTTHQSASSKTTNGPHVSSSAEHSSTTLGPAVTIMVTDNSVSSPTSNLGHTVEGNTSPGVGQIKAPPGGSTLPIAIGVAVGGVALVAAIATVVIVMKRRSPTPVPSSTPAPDVKADVTPEPVYDTVREEEEGGVRLALSGATCSYSTIGQPNVTSDPDRQVPVYSKPDKKKAKTPPNMEDLYTKPLKKESGEVENVLYESAGDFSGASPSQEGGTDNVLYASADEI